MKTFLASIFVFFFTLNAGAVVTLSLAQQKEAKKILDGWWNGPTNFAPDVFKGEVVAVGDADSSGQTQSLTSKVVGLHPRSCQKGLRKISLYEQFSKHISFIKESRYHEPSQKIYFLIDHTVLPFPMQLQFQLQRITGPGEYPFTFKDGIFKDLQGKIKIATVGNRCLYFMQVDWKGQTTKIPDVVVGAFAQTLSKLGLEHLIRISTY